MLAEAEYLQGNETSAVKRINEVRARAGLPDYDPDYVPSDPEETVRTVWEQLIHERRCEFAGENQRWFDLVRMYPKEEPDRPDAKPQRQLRRKRICSCRSPIRSTCSIPRACTRTRAINLRSAKHDTNT